MRSAHAVADVRSAEQALMARLPPGALMQRAAAGLAAVCAGLIPRVYGSRVLAVAAGTRVHEAGAEALRSAEGRVTRPDLHAFPTRSTSANAIPLLHLG